MEFPPTIPPPYDATIHHRAREEHQAQHSKRTPSPFHFQTITAFSLAMRRYEVKTNSTRMYWARDETDDAELPFSLLPRMRLMLHNSYNHSSLLWKANVFKAGGVFFRSTQNHQRDKDRFNPSTHCPPADCFQSRLHSTPFHSNVGDSLRLALRES